MLFQGGDLVFDRVRQPVVIQVHISFGMGRGHPHAFPGYHMAWDAYHSGIGRDFFQHYAASTDLGSFSHRKRTQDFGTAGHHHIVSDGGVPLPFFFSGAAQGHSLVKGNIIADDGGFPDDNAGTMIDEESFPDLSTGMDLDTSQEPGQSGNEPSRDEPGSLIKEMGNPIGPDGVESGIAKQDFQGILYGRIPLFDDSDIIAHGCKHKSFLPFGHKKRPPPHRGDLLAVPL